MRALAALIERSEAGRRLGRRPGLLRRRSVGRLELLWMPYYLVTLQLGEERRVLRVLVDSRGGGATCLVGEVVWGEAPPTLGAPILSAVEAIASARALLRRGVLVERRRRFASCEITQQQAELVAYPFWMEVFERLRRRYDIRLLDAVGGRRAGAETRRSVLAALVEEARERKSEPLPALGEVRP